MGSCIIDEILAAAVMRSRAVAGYSVERKLCEAVEGIVVEGLDR